MGSELKFGWIGHTTLKPARLSLLLFSMMFSRSSRMARRVRSFSVGAAAPPPNGPGVMVTVGIPVAMIAGAGGYYYYTNVDETLGGILPASFVHVPTPSSVSSTSTAKLAAPKPPAAIKAPAAKPIAPSSAKAISATANASTEKAERQALALATTLSISEQAVVMSQSAQPAKAHNGGKVQAAGESSKVKTAAPVVAAPVAAAAPTSVSAPVAATSTAAPVPSPAATAVEKAHAEMRALLYKDISSVLKKEFSESANVEVSKLSESALREKVVRLLEESHERARLEGIRLAEFLERSDNAWLKKVRAAHTTVYLWRMSSSHLTPPSPLYPHPPLYHSFLPSLRALPIVHAILLTCRLPRHHENCGKKLYRWVTDCQSELGT